MPTNRLPKKGIVDSIIYLYEQLKEIKRIMCCEDPGFTPTGVTADRPTLPNIGTVFFDTTLGYPIWYDGTDWVDSTGTAV